MPKYHLANSRTERCRNRNTNKGLVDLKITISKKNNFIVELRKNLDNFRSENTYLDNTYKFLYNMYYKLYNDFEELSGAYCQLKKDKEDLEKKYKDLLDEFVEKEIKIEN
jgi:hypothetical protein|tara:strand:+ start:18817 stop:19146 length:330 start_codon:yes stop_codon:yes gene_type:complete